VPTLNGNFFLDLEAEEPALPLLIMGYHAQDAFSRSPCRPPLGTFFWTF
jgi:hypothetical protein